MTGWQFTMKSGFQQAPSEVLGTCTAGGTQGEGIAARTWGNKGNEKPGKLAFGQQGQSMMKHTTLHPTKVDNKANRAMTCGHENQNAH